MSNGTFNQNAYMMANMTPEERAAYQEQLNQQARTQGVIGGLAGAWDIGAGAIGQRQAEGDIESLGAQSDAIRQQMKDLTAPKIMSPENQAAAVRNATILGAGKPQEDSSELAAAKMAMESGADPTKIQRALTEAEAQKDERARLEQQGAFREGLGYASQDAMSEYQKQRGDIDMDYDENQRAIEMAQQQSLMAQQQKQRGTSNLIQGGAKYLQGGGGQKLMSGAQGLLGGGDGGGGGNGGFLGGDYQFGDLSGGGLGGDGGGGLGGEGGGFGFGDYGGGGLGSGGLGGDGGSFDTGVFDYDGGGFDFGGFGGADGMRVPYEDGGAVQLTPGAFNHDDGDGIYEEGENEMSLVRHMAGGKVEDTGIRLTGGEYVINPKQSERTKKAYERIKRKKDPSRADYKALYEALSFLDDPQFD